MTCGTKGGLVSKWKQSMNLVVTTNGEKSAEVIVPRRLQTSWEGLNFRRYKLMNVTESRFKNRQLHMEDYLQMVSAEQKEYAEVFDYRKIAEKSSIITGYWTDNLLDLILRKDNLNKAYKRVKSNKGAGGTDGMQVDELLPYLKENQETLIWQIRNGRYKPNPVRRVEIPKETKGEYRKLGVPTVVDRVIQQAITQELMPIYEEQFSENRFGFRPQKGQHDALRQCQKNVNDGYVYVVDMDLEKFFDTVCQSKLIEVLSRTIKDGRVISLMDYKGNVTVKIDGLAASAASVIAMAGTKVLMSPVAMMMIHNPATIAIGDTAEMKKAIEMLDEVKESIMNAYEIKTGLNRTKISHLMDAESWFNAKKAVELGFADEILFDKEKEENPEEKKEEKEEELEAILFSRSAVTNSFFNKLISGKPEKKVNISELEKRLSLLKP